MINMLEVLMVRLTIKNGYVMFSHNYNCKMCNICAMGLSEGKEGIKGNI